MDTEARSDVHQARVYPRMEAVYGMGIKYLLNMPIAADDDFVLYLSKKLQ